jgi:DNA polymerase-4
MTGLRVLFVQATGRQAPGGLETLLGLLADITPVVEALPPDAALADVGGSVRYFHRDAVEIGHLVRVRALAWHGLDCTVGVAASPLLARMAAHGGLPGTVRVVRDDPAEVAAFLNPRPVAALPGVGPSTARTLGDYGLDTIGRIAATPVPTLQRILGVRMGRTLHQHAHGVDPTPVVPKAPARSATADYRFDPHELDDEQRRRALLALAVDLGLRLRSDGQVGRALTLTVSYADRSSTTRTRAFPEPTAHAPVLSGTAYALHDALGLQRARVTALSLRVEDLTAAELSSHQLTFDRQATNARRVESVVDRIAAKWPGSVGPAALARFPRRDTFRAS